MPNHIPEPNHIPQVPAPNPAPEMIPHHEPLHQLEPEPPHPLVRVSIRNRRRPSYLNDYHCNLATQTMPLNTNSTYPLSNYLSYHHLSYQYRQFSLTLSTVIEPKIFHEAIKHPNWQDAIQ